LHARVRPTLRNEADIVIPSVRIAIFVDGCFWHMCPRHGTTPISNRAWWRRKLEANRARDAKTSALFRREAWRVVRVWEHEEADNAARRIARIATSRYAAARVRD